MAFLTIYNNMTKRYEKKIIDTRGMTSYIPYSDGTHLFFGKKRVVVENCASSKRTIKLSKSKSDVLVIEPIFKETK